MTVKIIKFPICIIKGHVLDTPSIINFIDSGNHLKKCSRCGLYHARSSLSGWPITLSEREAMKWKREFIQEIGAMEDLVAAYGQD